MSRLPESLGGFSLAVVGFLNSTTNQTVHWAEISELHWTNLKGLFERLEPNILV
jgi:hypothetical protein